MPLETIERDHWQADFLFLPSNNIQQELKPESLVELFTGLRDLLPSSEACPTHWTFPGLHGGGIVRLQVEVGGAPQISQPGIATGRNALGWLIELTPNRLMIRHQQHVFGKTWGESEASAKNFGKRVVSSEDFPNGEQFVDIVLRAIQILPGVMSASIGRVAVSTNYAGLTGDIHPGSWIAHRFSVGQEAPMPLPLNAISLYSHRSLEYELLQNRRQVWNDNWNIGSWFDPETGVHRENFGVTFGTSIKTAIDQERDVGGSPHESIDLEEVFGFFSAQGDSPFNRLIDRSQSKFENVELTEIRLGQEQEQEA